MPESRPLAGDPVLSGVAAISKYLYGTDDAYHQRRVRHLINSRVIPTKKVAGRLESRPSWLDAVYAEPDQPNGRDGK
jgi:hypothetical protein